MLKYDVKWFPAGEYYHIIVPSAPYRSVISKWRYTPVSCWPGLLYIGIWRPGEYYYIYTCI